MCKSNQRHLEPTHEYKTTLPSPTKLKRKLPVSLQKAHVRDLVCTGEIPESHIGGNTGMSQSSEYCRRPD